MFNRKRYYKPFPLILIVVIAIIAVISIAHLRFVILNVFLLPLRITSGFIADTKAMVLYKFILNENQQLKKEVSYLHADSLIVKELRQENERLKRLLAFKEQAPFTTVAARVIARDASNWSRGIVIDKGVSQGIKAGNVVITDAGLAGRVIEARAGISKIVLINDANNSVSAVIQRSRDEGLISGTILGAVVMRYLDKDSDVTVGDIVLTSGITKNYPASIFIGKVETVNEDPQGLGKYCKVRPFANLKQMEEVLVIVK